MSEESDCGEGGVGGLGGDAIEATDGVRVRGALRCCVGVIAGLVGRKHRVVTVTPFTVTARMLPCASLLLEPTSVDVFASVP